MSCGCKYKNKSTCLGKCFCFGGQKDSKGSAFQFRYAKKSDCVRLRRVGFESIVLSTKKDNRFWRLPFILAGAEGLERLCLSISLREKIRLCSASSSRVRVHCFVDKKDNRFWRLPFILWQGQKDSKGSAFQFRYAKKSDCVRLRRVGFESIVSSTKKDNRFLAIIFYFVAGAEGLERLCLSISLREKIRLCSASPSRVRVHCFVDKKR